MGPQTKSLFVALVTLFPLRVCNEKHDDDGHGDSSKEDLKVFLMRISLSTCWQLLPADATDCILFGTHLDQHFEKPDSQKPKRIH